MSSFDETRMIFLGGKKIWKGKFQFCGCHALKLLNATKD
jgi:hypothetical protein